MFLIYPALKMKLILRYIIVFKFVIEMFCLTNFSLVSKMNTLNRSSAITLESNILGPKLEFL